MISLEINIVKLQNKIKIIDKQIESSNENIENFKNMRNKILEDIEKLNASKDSVNQFFISNHSKIVNISASDLWDLYQEYCTNNGIEI